MQSAAGWPAPPPSRVSAGARDVEIRALERVACRLTFLGPTGLPVEGGWVSLQQRAGALGGEGAYGGEINVEIGADGVAELTGLERGGTFALSIDLVDGLRDLDVDAWTPKDETFRMEAEKAVAGRVVDMSGAAASAAVVVGLRAPDGTVDWARCAADGTFRFQDVADGPHHLWAFFEGQRFRAGHPPLAQAVEVEGGDRRVELRLASLRDLEVRVAKVEGVDLSKSDVWLRRMDDPDAVGAILGLAPTSEGTARFRGLVPGSRYRLWFHVGERGLQALREVLPEDDAIDVVLQPGGVVEGHVQLPPNASKARVRVVAPGVRLRADVRPEGGFSLRALPEGAWTLEASCEVDGVRRARRAPSPVKAGERVVFDLREP